MLNQLLSQHTALVPGAPLWIMPTQKNSTWAQRVDWYLNFQISFSGVQKKSELTKVQLEELKDLELPIYEPLRADDLPLMVGSSRLLPNEQTVVVPFSGDLAPWIEEIKRIWQSMAKPKCRIFLPTGVTFGEMAGQWREMPQEISVVEDQAVKQTSKQNR